MSRRPTKPTEDGERDPGNVVLRRVDADKLAPMVHDDGDSLLERLFQLVALADPAKSPNENEARNAAMKACELLRRHQEHVAFDPGRPPRGTVHPLVAAFDEHGVIPKQVSSATWCMSCSEVIQAGSQVAWHHRVGATHMTCREWWAAYDFSKLPPEPEEDF
ncbi:MAG: DUF2786 domain-containing protein [Polyangiaceae bacterium]|jgi:hypothetical protein